MRTGTIFAGLLVLWSVLIITGLVAWLILCDRPITEKVWPNLAGIITAILGPAGLNLSVNEVRKALENGGLNMFGKKKEPEEGKVN